MAYRIQHTPYLSVTALAQRQLDDPGSAFLTAPDQQCVCWGGDFTLADSQTF